MSLKAHYVTQQSVYTSPLLGPLTNRRIKHYQKLGYFSQSAIVERKEQRQKKQSKKRLSKDAVFAKFDLWNVKLM